MRYTPGSALARLAASKILAWKGNIMRQQILFDIAVIVVPIALILIPETVELIVKRYFSTKKLEH
jgi:hypothetical protein